MDHSEIHASIDLAFQYYQAGQGARAEFELGRLLVSNPGNPYILAALSELYYFAGDMQKTVLYAQSAKNSLKQDASLAETLYVSKMLRAAGENEQAFTTAMNYPVSDSAGTVDLYPIAVHMQNLMRLEEANVLFSQIPKSGMDEAMLTSYGMSKLFTGQIDEAKQLFLDALAIKQDTPFAAWQLSMLNEQEGRIERIVNFERALQSELPTEDEVMLRFALYNEHEAKGDSVKAFDYLRSANLVRCKNQPFDHLENSEKIENYIERLHKIEFTNSELDYSTLPAPVFIFGLPRTGTTLLEKCVTSLAEVEAVGEHMDFRKELELQTNLRFSSPFDIVIRPFEDQLDLQLAGSRYLEKTAWRAHGRPYYTDKENSNFAYAGLIANAIPSARIIHIRRNPMDSCFSGFRQLFAPGAYKASYSLTDLEAYYRNYERMMTFWRTALGPRLLEIHYEDLVLRNSETMRKIKDYCRFKDTASASEQKPYKASTLSAAQVQKPIHAGNINAWAKYAEHLRPLRQALDAEYTAYMREIEGVEIL